MPAAPPTEAREAGTTRTRVALGAVTNIRALPSREISQIIIELPEEFHVALTSLVYGQDVLLMRSPLPDAPHGVKDVGQVDDLVDLRADGTSAQSPVAQCVHGLVSLVRAVPSRMVTVMHIDIPSDQHVQVTSLLFGSTCLALPCQLPPGTKYGLLSPAADNGQPQAREASRTTSQDHHAHTPSRSSVHRGLGISQRAEGQGPRDPLKWVSARCKEELFQAFLQVDSEAAARATVRARCGMESCSELTHRTDAVRLFLREIHQPYAAFERQRNLTAARESADGFIAAASEDAPPEDDGSDHADSVRRAASPFRSLAGRSG